MNRRALASLIDHTCLAPDAGAVRIERACDEAVEFGMRVCVAPVWVARAAARVGGRTGVVSVAGFPHGNTTTAAKCAEALDAVRAGASEVDMVMHLGALKEREDEAVVADIRAVAGVVHAAPALVKVIIETALLSREEILLACRLAAEAGADFVKTSTGFAAAGATVGNVRLMRGAVPGAVGVKAAGGIRDYETALAMIEAGANRIGSSASLDILRGAPEA